MNITHLYEKKPLTVGIWLNGLLLEKNISQRRLAQLTGMSAVGINKIIGDKNKSVRKSSIIAILRTLFSDDEERMIREYETFKILQK